MKKFMFYAIRWQLSTPILWACIKYLRVIVDSDLILTIIANFIGACIFFWVDQFIFVVKYYNPLWEIKSHVECADCKKLCRYGFRIALKHKYDKTREKVPEFRCYHCAIEKAKSMGIKL